MFSTVKRFFKVLIENKIKIIFSYNLFFHTQINCFYFVQLLNHIFQI